jgi:RHS repeat-associated protein
LTQESAWEEITKNHAYTYDDTRGTQWNTPQCSERGNRLTAVDNQTNTFDDNGNMTSDGVYAYTYDSANRLSGVNKEGTAISYSYNGLGDRTKQTINGSEKSFVLDLNSGLTQVLAYDTETYIYGLDRLGYEKVDEDYEYLPDALGSVRQVVKTSGANVGLTLAQSYDPYGNVLSTNGETASYGFTGEWQDSSTNGLVYLRARTYNPETGTFLSKDPWDGDANTPMSYTKWAYTYGNPVNYTDPSGMISSDKDEVKKAEELVNSLQNTYNVNIKVDWGMKQYAIPVPQPGDNKEECNWEPGNWSLDELRRVYDQVTIMAKGMGGNNQFIKKTGGISISQDKTGNAAGLTWPHRIVYTDADSSFTYWTVMHELAHAWDANYNWNLSKELEKFTGGYTNKTLSNIKTTLNLCDTDHRYPGCNIAGYYYGGKAPKGSDVNFNREEDFAESVTSYFYEEEAENMVRRYKGTEYEKNLYYIDYSQTSRWKFVDTLLNK